MADTDPRRFSAAADRNTAPIVAALRELLPEAGLALEIASGSGQHAARFAQALPGWRWQPSETDASAFASIRAWAAESGAGRVLEPLAVDVTAESELPAAVFDAVFCANLLHIAPAAAMSGLMRVAARHLAADGRLLIYGPFWVEGESSAPSNRAFDAALRSRDPAWGVRTLASVSDAGRAFGLELARRIAMPANNQLLVFRRTENGRSAAGSP